MLKERETRHTVDFADKEDMYEAFKQADADKNWAWEFPDDGSMKATLEW